MEIVKEFATDNLDTEIIIYQSLRNDIESIKNLIF